MERGSDNNNNASSEKKRKKLFIKYRKNFCPFSWVKKVFFLRMFILALIFTLLFSVSIALRFPKLLSTQKFVQSSTKCTICQANDLTIRDTDDLTIRDIDSLSTKDILRAIHSTGVSANQLFDGVDIAKSSPGINKFVIGNPKIFYNKKKLSRLYFDNEFDDLNMPLSSIARMLPVIYIADVHPEYGTVGFLLNKPVYSSPQLS